MKSPKEVLLQRHRGMQSKLDALREGALETLRQERAGATELASSTTTVVGAISLINSLRWHFTSLAAIWVAILILNYEPQKPGTGGVVSSTSPTSEQMAAVWLESRRQLLEMLHEKRDGAIPPPSSSIPVEGPLLQHISRTA